MTDIVDRLRSWGTGYSVHKEAADEIEKLRAALRVLNDLIVYLDAGEIELHRVRQFIESTLGEKE